MPSHPLRSLLAALVPVFLGLGAPASALDPNKSITQYVHDVWQTEQGLPQNSIMAIVQTRDGYLWLGTQEGLVRFDGVRFTVFDRQNTPELPENFVWTLLEDGAGRLWVRTLRGWLVRLEDGKFTRVTKDASERVRSLFRDRRGRVWVQAIRDGALVRLEGERQVRDTAMVPTPDDSMLAFAEDGQGALWVGTGDDLARLQGRTRRLYTPTDGLGAGGVRALLASRDGSLWIGTQSGGLSRIKDGRLTTLTTRDGLSGNRIYSLYEDRDGSVWVGTGGNGLNRLRDGRVDVFSAKHGLSNDTVLAFHEDSEGSLWIGTMEGGLNRLRDGPITALTTREGLSHDVTHGVLEDREGGVWIATQAGLNRLHDGRLTVYTAKDGLAHDAVHSIHEGRDGGLWIGTQNGLSQRAGARFRAFTETSGRHVYGIQQDRDGTLWFAQGTPAGLVRFRAGRFTLFTDKDGMAGGLVGPVVEDREGSLWAGCYRGLTRLAAGRFTSFTTKEGLSNDYVVSLHADREGGLWIGTVGGGLNFMKDGRLTAFTRQQGLFDDTVFTILEDDVGRLWMGSNKGIFRVAKQELIEVAAGRHARVSSVAYGAADGMKSTECSPFGGGKTRDGRLWFATTRGVVWIDPAHLPTNTIPPPVAVEEVLLDQRLAPSAGELRVPAGARAPSRSTTRP